MFQFITFLPLLPFQKFGTEDVGAVNKPNKNSPLCFLETISYFYEEEFGTIV